MDRVREILRAAGVSDDAGTVRVWPTAGRLLGYQSRQRAYSAAGKVFPVLRLGRSLRVPRAWLEQQLGTGIVPHGDDEGDRRRAGG